MKLQVKNMFKGVLSWGFIALLLLGQSTMAQSDETRIIEPDASGETSEFVTINVKDANIADVLYAYSLQTGQSIVVGPDVVSDNVNVRLNNIPWEEAIDVILKPYGFGYRVVGDTILISKLENIVTVEGIEPLVSKVFNLKYLDAYDIKEICTAQLSGRGKYTILTTKSLPGWEFGGASGSGSGAASDAGIRRRKQQEELEKSKVFVVTDVPSAVSKVERILEKLDVLPQQVLIESQFMEISHGDLRDIGLDYISAMENVVQGGESSQSGGSGSSSGSSASILDAQENMLRVLNLTTGLLNPLDAGFAGSFSHDRGIRLSHSELGDSGVDVLFSFMEGLDGVNVLSAPRILTMNNQEAAILIGEKFPIIESETSSGSGSGVTSTSLDYYENIGIQLNVIPQVCDNNFVNMIVHPAVSEIASFEAGVVTADSGSSTSGSRYPVLKIREAETQILIKSENTAVIGGLRRQRDRELVDKVPFLGDIPFLGRLFRRETVTHEDIDLLIFIKASIIDESEYAAASLEDEAYMLEGMGLLESEEEPEVEADDEPPMVWQEPVDAATIEVESVAAVSESVAADEEVMVETELEEMPEAYYADEYSDSDSDNMMAIIENMDADKVEQEFLSESSVDETLADDGLLSE